MSSCGWRTKWRRFRRVTTQVSPAARAQPLATGAPAGASAVARAPASSPSRPRHRLVAAAAPSSLGGVPVSSRKTSSSVGRRRARSLAAMPASRSAAAAAVTSSTPSRLRRHRELVRALGGLGIAATDRGQGDVSARSRSSALASWTSRTWPPTRSLSSSRRALGDHPPVVDDRDAVGELVGLLEVLGGEQHRRAVVDEARGRCSRSRCGCAGPARSSARRGRACGARLIRLEARSSRRRIPPE